MRKGKSRAAILLLAGLIWGAGVGLADTAQLHTTAGLAFYYQGHLKEAYEEFVSALRLDPNSVEAHYNLGRLFEKQNRYAEALERYRDALSLRSDHHGALEGMERMGFYVEPRALPDTSFPDESAKQEALGRELQAIHDLNRSKLYNVALKRVSDARKLFPDEPRLDLAEARALIATGDLNEAVRKLRRAGRSLPGSWAIQYHLAVNLYKLGYPDDALRHGKRAVELEPSNPKGHKILAKIYDLKADTSLSFDRLFEASRLDPSDKALAARVRLQARKLGLIHYTSGLYYFNQREWKLAKGELEAALQSGKLTDEQRAIAQQFLIVSEFSLAEVAGTIAELQKNRKIEEQGFLGKRIGFQELIRSPNAFREGTQVSFEGWIVSSRGDPSMELVVTTDPGDVLGVRTRLGRGGISTEDLEFNLGIQNVVAGIDRGSNSANPSASQGQTSRGGPVVSPTRTSVAALDSLGRGRSIPGGQVDFRSASKLERWFTAKMPRPLPKDSRIRARSRIRIEGRLAKPQYIKNDYNGLFSRRPQPTVDVTYISVQRETRGPLEARLLRLPQTDVDTPPGLSGPLVINFLELSELQRKNR